jgi:TIR domain
VPGVSSRGIFLSYRREDAAPYARLLQIQLRERFPDVPVFLDVNSIEVGLDFAEVIREAIDSCAVLVALIGDKWATLADEQGRPRLHNPDDFVRFEVQAALERGVRVIPVLVDGAKPLRQEQLPAELRKLARLNALELSHGRYEYDAGRLLDLIQHVLAAASGTRIAPESSPTTDAEAPAVPHGVRPDGNAVGQMTQEDAEPVRNDRIEQLTSQAHLVSAWIEEPLIDTKPYPQLTAVVENGSNQVIHEVSISLQLGVLGKFHRWLASMGPHEVREVRISIPGSPRSNLVMPQVAFVDASGRRWLRSGYQLREPTNKDMVEHWAQHPGSYNSEKEHPTLWTSKTKDNPMGIRRNLRNNGTDESQS